MGIVIGYFASTEQMEKGNVLTAKSNDSLFKIYNTIDDLLFATKLSKDLYIYEIELLSFVDMVEDVLISDKIRISDGANITEDKISDQIYMDKNKYNYCRLIKDKSNLRNSIEDEYIIFLYCCYVEDRPELNSKINSPRYKKLYKEQVKGIESDSLISSALKSPMSMAFVLTKRF